MIVLNKNADKVNLDMDRYSEMIPNTFKAKDIISDKEMEIKNILEIPAKTAMILEIK